MSLGSYLIGAGSGGVRVLGKGVGFKGVRFDWRLCPKTGDPAEEHQDLEVSQPYFSALNPKGGTKGVRSRAGW